MKAVIRRSVTVSGSVLVISLIISAVFGITLASYLVLVDHQSKSVYRSQIWNSSMVVAEAGVEDGLELLNKYILTPNIKGWTNAYTEDGWKREGNGVVYYLEKRYMDASKRAYYTVFITNINDTLPVIRSTSYVPGPHWISGSPPVSRTIIVQTKLDPLFNVAMAALGAIDLKGNNIETDSYISGDTNYSNNGFYDKNKRRAGGDVATNNTLTNSVLSVGNADIAGKVITGPYGSVTIGPNGTVGDLTWVATQKGIQDGWYQNDMNVVFKDVVEPVTTWLQPDASVGTGGAGTVTLGDGTSQSFDHVFLVPGDYLIAENKSVYVGTNVTVRLKVTAPAYSPGSIYVAGVGGLSGKMTAYVASQKLTLGTEHKSQSGKPADLQFLGLTTCKEIKYNGNGNFSGVIYAPQAEFNLVGGGNDSWDFCGASVTKMVQMNGHYKFHYDEDLRNWGPTLGFRGRFWKEL